MITKLYVEEFLWNYNYNGIHNMFVTYLSLEVLRERFERSHWNLNLNTQFTYKINFTHDLINYNPTASYM